MLLSDTHDETSIVDEFEASVCLVVQLSVWSADPKEPQLDKAPVHAMVCRY